MKDKAVLGVEGELRFFCFPLALLSTDVKLRVKLKAVLASARFRPVVLRWVSVQ